MKGCIEDRNLRTLDKLFHAEFLMGDRQVGDLVYELLQNECSEDVFIFLIKQNGGSPLDIREIAMILKPRYVKYINANWNVIMRGCVVHYDLSLLFEIMSTKGERMSANLLHHFVKFADSIVHDKLRALELMLDLWYPQVSLDPADEIHHLTASLAGYEFVYTILKTIIDKLGMLYDSKQFIEIFFTQYIKYKRNLDFEEAILPFLDLINPDPLILFQKGVEFKLPHILNIAHGLALNHTGEK